MSDTRWRSEAHADHGWNPPFARAPSPPRAGDPTHVRPRPRSAVRDPDLRWDRRRSAGTGPLCRHGCAGSGGPCRSAARRPLWSSNPQEERSPPCERTSPASAWGIAYTSSRLTLPRRSGAWRSGALLTSPWPTLRGPLVDTGDVSRTLGELSHWRVYPYAQRLRSFSSTRTARPPHLSKDWGACKLRRLR